MSQRGPSSEELQAQAVAAKLELDAHRELAGGLEAKLHSSSSSAPSDAMNTPNSPVFPSSLLSSIAAAPSSSSRYPGALRSFILRCAWGLGTLNAAASAASARMRSIIILCALDQLIHGEELLTPRRIEASASRRVITAAEIREAFRGGGSPVAPGIAALPHQTSYPR